MKHFHIWGVVVEGKEKSVKRLQQLDSVRESRALRQYHQDKGKYDYCQMVFMAKALDNGEPARPVVTG